MLGDACRRHAPGGPYRGGWVGKSCVGCRLHDACDPSRIMACHGSDRMCYWCTPDRWWVPEGVYMCIFSALGGLQGDLAALLADGKAKPLTRP